MRSNFLNFLAFVSTLATIPAFCYVGVYEGFFVGGGMVLEAMFSDTIDTFGLFFGVLYLGASCFTAAVAIFVLLIAAVWFRVASLENTRREVAQRSGRIY